MRRGEQSETKRKSREGGGWAATIRLKIPSCKSKRKGERGPLRNDELGEKTPGKKRTLVDNSREKTAPEQIVKGQGGRNVWATELRLGRRIESESPFPHASLKKGGQKHVGRTYVRKSRIWTLTA